VPAANLAKRPPRRSSKRPTLRGTQLLKPCQLEREQPQQERSIRILASGLAGGKGAGPSRSTFASPIACAGGPLHAAATEVHDAPTTADTTIRINSKRSDCLRFTSRSSVLSTPARRQASQRPQRTWDHYARLRKGDDPSGENKPNGGQVLELLVVEGEGLPVSLPASSPRLLIPLVFGLPPGLLGLLFPFGPRLPGPVRSSVGGRGGIAHSVTWAFGRLVHRDWWFAGLSLRARYLVLLRRSNKKPDRTPTPITGPFEYTGLVEGTPVRAPTPAPPISMK
jgi:hypothetical protein